MLTAVNVSSGMAINYYFVKNYHHQGKSRWSGEGAKKLKLSGPIDDEKKFTNVIEGRSPSGRKQLNARILNPDKRRAALDCTFSAPKSVSIMALVSGDDRLIAAHHQALMDVLGLMERHHALTRVMQDGRQRKVSTDNLLVAQFDHIESRELDPHLHTHCLVMNATQTSDGRWMSLVNSEIFTNKKALGMVYQGYLAVGVQGLGYEIELKEHGQFDIKGFSQKDLKVFSKRRQQILALTGNSSSWAERNQAWDLTRQLKQKMTETELKSLWHREVTQLGISFIKPNSGVALTPVESDRTLEDALAEEIAYRNETNQKSTSPPVNEEKNETNVKMLLKQTLQELDKQQMLDLFVEVGKYAKGETVTGEQVDRLLHQARQVDCPLTFEEKMNMVRELVREDKSQIMNSLGINQPNEKKQSSLSR